MKIHGGPFLFAFLALCTQRVTALPWTVSYGDKVGVKSTASSDAVDGKPEVLYSPLRVGYESIPLISRPLAVQATANDEFQMPADLGSRPKSEFADEEDYQIEEPGPVSIMSSAPPNEPPRTDENSPAGTGEQALTW